ncbi:hypothetical protein ACW2Q0_04900 [Nocardia sp. R16R-3T]
MKLKAQALLDAMTTGGAAGESRRTVWWDKVCAAGIVSPNSDLKDSESEENSGSGPHRFGDRASI